MSDASNAEASRRTVLKGSAIGAGALLTASGLTATARAAGAATPKASSTNGVQPQQTGDLYFLKLDGIDGEGTTNGYEKWIDITDFSFGASRAAVDGTSTGKQPKEMELTVEADLSKASPLMLLSAFDGKQIKTANLTVTDGRLNAFLKIDLTDVIVSSFRIGAINSGRPEDSASLNFGKIKFSYFPQNADGVLQTPVRMQWDLRSEKV